MQHRAQPSVSVVRIADIEQLGQARGSGCTWSADRGASGTSCAEKSTHALQDNEADCGGAQDLALGALRETGLKLLPDVRQDGRGQRGRRCLDIDRQVCHHRDVLGLVLILLLILTWIQAQI